MAYSADFSSLSSLRIIVYYLEISLFDLNEPPIRLFFYVTDATTNSAMGDLGDVGLWILKLFLETKTFDGFGKVGWAYSLAVSFY